MPLAPVITLKLYNPETDEVEKELTRTFVPWKMLKKATRLAEVVDKAPDELGDEEIDAIAGYVIELFGKGLTIEKIDECADVADMQSVIKSIIARASGIVDPTLPPAAK